MPHSGPYGAERSEIDEIAALQATLNHGRALHRAARERLGPLPPHRPTRRKRLRNQIRNQIRHWRTALARRIAPWIEDW